MCLLVCVHCMHTGACGGQKRVLESLELEFQVVLSSPGLELGAEPWFLLEQHVF